MRSRYAAFTLGLGEYLVATLAASHPDLAMPRAELVRELSRVKDRQRFLGLRIVHAEGAEVLFDARIFEGGKDRSFAELSTFVREGGAWKYASGRMLPSKALPAGFTYEEARLSFERASGS
jgi:SEC-C motif-containing protein